MKTSEYNRCVDLHSDGMFRFILKNTRDEERSRDVVQESFARLWVRIEEVSFEKAKSYLFTTAYHLMIDMIRKEKRMESFGVVEENKHAYEQGYSDLNEILHQALSQLPPVQKSVILLRDYEGYSYSEIGEIMKLTEAQVKVYIYRGRKFLKSYIGSIEKVM